MTDLLPQPVAGVVQAIAAVMAEMPAIGKDGTAPANMGGYKFRGIEDVTRALQPVFAKHGVVIAPHCRIARILPSPGQAVPRDREESPWQDVYVEVDWTIYGPDGSFITATTSGIGRDHTDKGANKAQTQAYKYLLMHLLCISDSKDDGDGASYEDPERYQPEPELTPIQKFLNVLGTLSDSQKAAMKQFAADNGKRLTGKAFNDEAMWFEDCQTEAERLMNLPEPKEEQPDG